MERKLQISSTRQRSVRADDALWLTLMNNVVEANPEAAAYWRIAKQIEAPCPCKESGGVVVKCRHPDCLLEYHIWCAADINGLELDGHRNLYFTCDDHISRIVFCTCHTPYDESIDMVSCDKCSEWFHCKCVEVNHKSVEKEDFICPPCRSNTRSIEELQQLRLANEEKERIANNRSETCRGIQLLLEVQIDVCPLIDFLHGVSDGLLSKLQASDIKNAIDTLMKVLTDEDVSSVFLASIGMDAMLQQWVTQLKQCQGNMLQHEKLMKQKVTMIVDQLVTMLGDANIFHKKYVSELRELSEGITSFKNSLASLIPEPAEVAEFEICSEAILWVLQVYELIHSPNMDCVEHVQALEKLVAGVDDIRSEMDRERHTQCCSLLFPNFKALCSIIESSTRNIKDRVSLAASFIADRRHLDDVHDIAELAASLTKLPIDTQHLESQLHALYKRLRNFEEIVEKILSSTIEPETAHLKSLVSEISDINIIPPSYYSLLHAINAVDLAQRCRSILKGINRTPIYQAQEVMHCVCDLLKETTHDQQPCLIQQLSRYLCTCKEEIDKLISLAQLLSREFVTSAGDVITEWKEQRDKENAWKMMHENIIVSEAEMAIEFFNDALSFIKSPRPSRIDELRRDILIAKELLLNNVAHKFPSTMQVYDDVQQRERELMETKDRTTRNWSDVSNEIKNINSGNPCTYEVFESIVNKALADNVIDAELSDKCSTIRSAADAFSREFVDVLKSVDQALLRTDYDAFSQLENYASRAATLPLRSRLREALNGRMMIKASFLKYTEKYKHYLGLIQEERELSSEVCHGIESLNSDTDAAYRKCKAINVTVEDRLSIGSDLLAMLFRMKNNSFYLFWRMRAQRVLARGNDLQSIDELIIQATESSAANLIESCSEWKEIRDVNVRSQSVRDKCNSALTCFYDGKKSVDAPLTGDDLFAENIATVVQTWQQHVLPTKRSISEALQLYEAQRKSVTSNSSKVLFPLRDVGSMESAVAEITVIEDTIGLVTRLRDLKLQNAHLSKISAVELIEWKEIEAALKSLKSCRGSLCCNPVIDVVLATGSAHIVDYFVALISTLEENGSAWIVKAKTLVPVQTTRKQRKESAKSFTIADYRELLEDPICWTIDLPHFAEVYETYNKAIQHKDIFDQLMCDKSGTSTSVDINEVDHNIVLKPLIKSIPPLLEEIELSPVYMPEKYILEWASRVFAWALTLKDDLVKPEPDTYGIATIMYGRSRLREGTSVMVDIPEETKRALVDSGLIVLVDSDSLRGDYRFCKTASVALKLARQIFDAFVADMDRTEAWEQNASMLAHTKPLSKDLLEKMEALLELYSKLKIVPDINTKKQLERAVESARNATPITNVVAYSGRIELPKSIKPGHVIPKPIKPEEYRPKLRKNDEEELEIVDVDGSGSPKHKRKLPRSATTATRKKLREGVAADVSSSVDHVCAVANCKWVAIEGSKYCSDECALRDVSAIFDALLDFRSIQTEQLPLISLTSSESNQSKSLQNNIIQNIYRSGVSAFKMMIPDEIAKRFDSMNEPHDCGAIQNVFQESSTKSVANTITNGSEVKNARRIILAAFPNSGTKLLDNYYAKNELNVNHLSVNCEVRSQVRESIEDVIVHGLLRGGVDNAVTSGAILACDIEEEMFTKHESLATPTAKNAYRKHQLMLTRNLKHDYNVILLKRLHAGEITVRDLAGMTAEQLADPKVQEQRELEVREAHQSMIIGKSTQAMISERIQETLKGDADTWRDSGKIMMTAEEISAVEAGVRGTFTVKEEITLPIKKSSPPVGQLRKPSVAHKPLPLIRPPTRPVDTGVIENISKRQRTETSVSSKDDGGGKLMSTRPPPALDTDFMSFEQATSPSSVKASSSSRSLKVKPVSELLNSFQEETDDVSVNFGDDVEHKPRPLKSSLLSTPPTQAAPVKLLSSTGTTQFTIHRPVGTTMECVAGVVDCRGQGIAKEYLNIDGRVKLSALLEFFTELLAKGKKVIVPFVFVLANNTPANVEAFRKVENEFVTHERVGMCQIEKECSQVYIIPPKILPKIQQIAKMLPKCLEIRDKSVHWMYGLMWSHAVGPPQFTHAKHEPFHVGPPDTTSPLVVPDSRMPAIAPRATAPPDKTGAHTPNPYIERKTSVAAMPDKLSSDVHDKIHKVLSMLEETGDIDKALQKLISKTNKGKIPFLFEGELGYNEFNARVEALKLKLALKLKPSDSKVDASATPAPTPSNNTPRTRIHEPKEVVKLSQATERCVENVVRLLQFYGRDGVLSSMLRGVYSKQYNHELVCEAADGRNISVSTAMAANRDIVGVYIESVLTYFHRDFAPKAK